MWTAILKAFSALKAGERLYDVTGWKNRQATANDLAVILNFFVAIARIFYPEFCPSDDVLLGISGGGTLILGALNSYFTRATTDKIGLK